MQTKNVKIIVFVPLTHCDIVRKAIGEANGGILGNYSYCSFSSKGIGRFKPNEKANPHIGETNKLEKVDEEKIEFICPRKTAKKVINAIKKVHPYEEIALDIYPLIEENDLKKYLR
ncbi:MAG: NIF3-related protein [archaeon GW2011_AR19]|nr:MAG: NIF3-related protein [archaeon GW2011_AR19]